MKRAFASLIFSGLRAFQVTAGRVRHASQQVEKIVLLFAFKLNDVAGKSFLQSRHFMKPLYVGKMVLSVDAYCFGAGFAFAGAGQQPKRTPVSS